MFYEVLVILKKKKIAHPPCLRCLAGVRVLLHLSATTKPFLPLCKSLEKKTFLERSFAEILAVKIVQYIVTKPKTQQKSNHNEAVANGWQNSDAYTYINSHHQHHVWVQHLQLILLHMVNTFMDYESTMRNKLIPGDIESGTTAWCQTKRNMGHQAKKNNPNNPMPITHTCMLLLNLPYISASLSVVKYTIHGISWDGIPSCISRIHCSPLPKKGISKTNLAIQGSINSCWPEVKVPWPRVDTDFRFGGGWGVNSDSQIRWVFAENRDNRPRSSVFFKRISSMNIANLFHTCLRLAYHLNHANHIRSFNKMNRGKQKTQWHSVENPLDVESFSWWKKFLALKQ